MPGYLLDTNHLGKALRRVSIVRDRIRQTRRRGIKIGTRIPAICGLEIGIRQLSRQDQNRRDLALLLDHVRVWPIDQSIVSSYGEIYLGVRRRGRVLSQVDLMSASLATVMNLTILTADRDFEAMPDIRTEDWTVDPD